jgi:HAD superfamily hydrolase (TIGR01549 family)
MDPIETRIISAKAIVFDFYGTLVEIDNEPPQMWENLITLGFNSHRELQWMFEPDAFDGCVTPCLDHTPGYDDWKRANLLQFLRLSGVPDRLVDEILVMLLEVEKQATKKAIPHANSILQLLRQFKKKIGLCSNWDYPIQPYLDRAGFPPFDGISVSAEIGARKPSALAFQDICVKLKVQASEAVFVGDNWQTDIVGSMRSGLTPVWIRQDQPSRGLPELVAEFETLAQFENYLRQSMR